jgi:hypothetical protein
MLVIRPKNTRECEPKQTEGVSSPLPWSQTLAIPAYAIVSCLIVNDALKVMMKRRRKTRPESCSS